MNSTTPEAFSAATIQVALFSSAWLEELRRDPEPVRGEPRRHGPVDLARRGTQQRCLDGSVEYDGPPCNETEVEVYAAIVRMAFRDWQELDVEQIVTEGARLRKLFPRLTARVVERRMRRW